MNEALERHAERLRKRLEEYEICHDPGSDSLHCWLCKEEWKDGDAPRHASDCLLSPEIIDELKGAPE